MRSPSPSLLLLFVVGLGCARSAPIIRPRGATASNAALRRGDRDSCPVRAIALVAGTAHTCALIADGTVRCWGANYGGQLGDGTTTFRSAPVAVEKLSSVVKITAGDRHTCALRQDGTVWCWGANDVGQLGKTHTAGRPVAMMGLSKEHQASPVVVAGIAGVTAIAAGATHSIALTAAGSLYSWGQLGFPLDRPDDRESFQHAVSRVTRIAAGADLDCAFGHNGVYCWGPDRSWVIPRSTGASAISELVGARMLDPFVIGHGIACGVDPTRSVHCWGERQSLGNGEKRSYGDPLGRDVTVDGLTDIVQLASRWETCAVTADGRVACWGGPMFSALEGDGDQVQPRPVWVSGISDAAKVVAGDSTTCVQTTEGSVWCWGENGYGQLGDATTESKAHPTRVRFCADGSETVFPEPPEGVALIAALQRDVCYGSCPVYSVRVYEDGTVIYRGDWHVRVRGGRKARLSPNDLETLRDAFRRANFLDLNYRCRFETTDASTARLFFTDSGKARLISHYHGCNGDPPALKTLEDDIDRLVGTNRWVGSVRHGQVDLGAMEGPLTVPGVVEETGEAIPHD